MAQLGVVHQTGCGLIPESHGLLLTQMAHHVCMPKSTLISTNFTEVVGRWYMCQACRRIFKKGFVTSHKLGVQTCILVGQLESTCIKFDNPHILGLCVYTLESSEVLVSIGCLSCSKFPIPPIVSS